MEPSSYFMENGFNQFQCPLCGRSVSIRKFDPTEFDDDVNGIRFEGLGYGRGFGVAEKGSILESGDPVLALIGDRVLEISRFLMDAGILTQSMIASHIPVLESQAQVDEREELIDDINAALKPYYGDEAFENLFDASKALLDQFLDYEEEENKEDDEEVAVDRSFEDDDLHDSYIDSENFESLSVLDKEILLAERKEEEEYENGE